MCLPLSEIEGYLHYYAYRFENRRFEHWELINEAWLKIHDLTEPKFSSAGIRWAIQHYIDEQYRQDYRGKPESKIQSIDTEVLEGLFFKDTLAAPENNTLENADFVDCLLHCSKLTLADKLFIDQRYFQNLKLKQLTQLYGCSFQNIYYKLNRIIDKLRKKAKVA